MNIHALFRRVYMFELINFMVFSSDIILLFYLTIVAVSYCTMYACVSM